MKIIENFLDKNLFKELQKLIMQSEFSWFQRKNTTLIDNKVSEDLGYFTHSFFNNNQINCSHYDKFIIPILNKLNCHAPIQIRANLSPSVFFIKDKASFHTDYKYPCKTSIFYINTCDIGTELKINNEIQLVKAEENKMLIFDSSIEHRSAVSKKPEFKYLINFNYY